MNPSDEQKGTGVPAAGEVSSPGSEHAVAPDRVESGEPAVQPADPQDSYRSEEHTSELQSLRHLVCRLLLEKKKKEAKDTTRNEIVHRASSRLRDNEYL